MGQGFHPINNSSCSREQEQTAGRPPDIIDAMVQDCELKCCKFIQAAWRAAGYDKHPLFRLPGVSVLNIYPDWMHVKHLGTDQYYYGSIRKRAVFSWHFLSSARILCRLDFHAWAVRVPAGHMLGRSVLALLVAYVMPESRARNLEVLCEQLHEEYKAQRVVNRVPMLKLSMFMGTGGGYPRLKAKAANTRAFGAPLLAVFRRHMQAGNRQHQMIELGSEITSSSDARALVNHMLDRLFFFSECGTLVSEDESEAFSSL